MTVSTAEEYDRRRAAAEGEWGRAQGQNSGLAPASLLAVAMFAIALTNVMRGRGSLLFMTCTFVAGVLFAVLLVRARGRANRAMRLLGIYESGLERVRGEKTQTGRTGEAFAEAGHLYAWDLGIVGPNSIFGMFATTRTALGEQELARLLLRPCSVEEARQRQQAVQELTPAIDVREQVALLGHSAYEQLPADSFERWLSAEARNYPKWLRPVLLVITAAWLLVLIFGLLRNVDPALLARNVGALLALQGAVCLQYRAAVREELGLAERLAGQTGLFRSGLALLRNASFSAERLRVLQAEAQGTEPALGPLERLLAMAEQRTKEWYYAPALLLGIGTHAAVGLENWRKQHADALRGWLHVWGEFDALLALGMYAAEHPENVYPQIEDADQAGVAQFVAEGLTHPLLRLNEAVANDVRLDEESRFLLISGSNMAGKSTLLRAIGTNAALGLAGAPVAARSLCMNALNIGAAITAGDSLAEGKSKFLAEVERLRAIVALARQARGRTLFLIDEIFSGTNSLDRRAAAEAVVRSLVDVGAVGAISTHDLTLTEIAEIAELHGHNVHMASPDEDDPLAFDYLLKPGMNRTTNALAIVRMLGLIE